MATTLDPVFYHPLKLCTDQHLLKTNLNNKDTKVSRIQSSTSDSSPPVAQTSLTSSTASRLSRQSLSETSVQNSSEESGSSPHRLRQPSSSSRITADIFRSLDIEPINTQLDRQRSYTSHTQSQPGMLSSNRRLVRLLPGINGRTRRQPRVANSSPSDDQAASIPFGSHFQPSSNSDPLDSQSTSNLPPIVPSTPIRRLDIQHSTEQEAPFQVSVLGTSLELLLLPDAPEYLESDLSNFFLGPPATPLRRLQAVGGVDEQAQTLFSQMGERVQMPMILPGDFAEEVVEPSLYFIPQALAGDESAAGIRSRYAPPSVLDLGNTLAFKDGTISWHALSGAGFKVAKGKKGIGIDWNVPQLQARVSTGWDNVVINTKADLSHQELGVGVGYKDYGVAVIRNNLEDGTGVEVRTPIVEVGTLASFLDRNYGQRIKVKDFEIMARHDFDENLNPNPQKLATEFMWAFKDIGVGVGTDVHDARYGVSVGVKGYQFSVLRDFDEFQTDFVGNFGDGWQLYLSGNMPDHKNQAVAGRVGFGKMNKAYVMAGAGVGRDAIPEFNAHVKTKKAAVVLDLEGSALGVKTLVAGISLGKFTYVWNAKLALDNLRVPLLLDPVDLRRFLHPGPLPFPGLP